MKYEKKYDIEFKHKAVAMFLEERLGYKTVFRRWASTIVRSEWLTTGEKELRGSGKERRLDGFEDRKAKDITKT